MSDKYLDSILSAFKKGEKMPIVEKPPVDNSATTLLSQSKGNKGLKQVNFGLKTANDSKPTVNNSKEKRYQQINPKGYLSRPSGKKEEWLTCYR